MNEKRRWGGSIVEIRLTWPFQTRVYGKSIRCINRRLDLSWDESYRNVISSEWKVILRRNVSNIHAWCKCLISRSLLTKNIVRCEACDSEMYKFVRVWKCFPNMGENGKEILKVWCIVLCGDRFLESSAIDSYFTFCRNFTSKTGNSIFVSSKFNSKNCDWKVPFVESNWWSYMKRQEFLSRELMRKVLNPEYSCRNWIDLSIVAFGRNLPIYAKCFTAVRT